MSEMKLLDPVATLIGDVVGSRSARDRAALHDVLTAALAGLNQASRPLVPLRVTVGDEFQGCFESLGAALSAALRVRLDLLPAVDVRIGLGWGRITVLDDSPRIEDGPGWWAAREAIEAVASDAGKAALRSSRTAYRRARDTSGPEEASVNAALRLRDQLVGGLSEPSLGVLRDLLDHRSQTEIATRLGVSASAVSQRVRSNGLGMIVAVESMLEGVR